MPTSNVEVIEIGIPGPPGAGVSASEKATFVTVTGSNTFTNKQAIQENAVDAFVVEKEDGTDVLVVDTTNKEVEIHNGGKIRVFSDAGTTEVASIDGATGNIQTDGIVTVSGGRVVGDTSVWSVVIDGGGSTIGTGVKFDVEVPYNALITAWDALGDQIGSIVVDIWQDTYANFSPTNADSICGAEKPTISASTKGQDTSLNSGNGWAVTKDRILRFNVDSVTTLQRVTIALKVTRT